MSGYKPFGLHDLCLLNMPESGLSLPRTLPGTSVGGGGGGGGMSREAVMSLPTPGSAFLSGNPGCLSSAGAGKGVAGPLG